MFQNIFNLTVLEIVGEIESILETYPHHPYQQAFSVPAFRQELIAYVLSRISNHYIVYDRDSNSEIESSHSSRTERNSRSAVIHEGIQHIFLKHFDQIQHQVPQERSADLEPSHWFG